jgi:hypothetical protein
MERPCTCLNFRTDIPYNVSMCRYCYLYATDERYRRLWSGKPSIVNSPCLYLGEWTGDMRLCGVG